MEAPPPPQPILRGLTLATACEGILKAKIFTECIMFVMQLYIFKVRV